MFGGVTSESWTSSGNSKADYAAFLFSLADGKAVSLVATFLDLFLSFNETVFEFELEKNWFQGK